MVTFFLGDAAADAFGFAGLAGSALELKDDNFFQFVMNKGDILIQTLLLSVLQIGLPLQPLLQPLLLLFLLLLLPVLPRLPSFQRWQQRPETYIY